MTWSCATLVLSSGVPTQVARGDHELDMKRLGTKDASSRQAGLGCKIVQLLLVRHIHLREL